MLLKRGHASHDFELNLTPIIDCFVTLICFLLLSATYVNLTGLDAKVPIAVPTATAPTKDENKFRLELTVKNTGIELHASGAGAASGRKWIPALKNPPANVETRQDLATLHAELVKIKRERPKEFSIEFNSEIEMPYGELVRFMDTTRNLSQADGALTVTDERNGKPVKVDLLFPDFVVAGLGAVTAKGK